MSLKNPVTRTAIDPGTVRLVAQRLNHYATPDPLHMIYISIYSVAKNKRATVRIPALATSPHSCCFVIFCTVSCSQFLFSDFCSFHQFFPCFSPPTLVACTLFDPLYRSSSSACRKAGPIQIMVHQYHSLQCTLSSRRFYILLSPVMLSSRSVPISSLSVS
jgi:hypothetical protein